MQNVKFQVKFVCEEPEDKFVCLTQNQHCSISPAEQRAQAQALALLHFVSKQRGIWAVRECPCGNLPGSWDLPFLLPSPM